MRMVLDTNCIIDLEQERVAAEDVRSLIGAWQNGRVELAVVAISASEKGSSSEIYGNYHNFQERLAKVGLIGVEELLPPCYGDICFWDKCIWSGEEIEKVINSLWNILFPGFNYKIVSQNWLNKLCDVLVAWACVNYKWQNLVTRDKIFHRNKEILHGLGIERILLPIEAANLIRLSSPYDREK
jgi:hypothetical protein